MTSCSDWSLALCNQRFIFAVPAGSVRYWSFCVIFEWTFFAKWKSRPTWLITFYALIVRKIQGRSFWKPLLGITNHIAICNCPAVFFIANAITILHCILMKTKLSIWWCTRKSFENVYFMLIFTPTKSTYQVTTRKPTSPDKYDSMNPTNLKCGI